MFDKARAKGHVDLTMKRYDGKTKPTPRQGKAPEKAKKGRSESTSEPEMMCLIRARLGNEKISSVVHAKEVNKFQLAYCNLLKNHMDGLKKQKKAKLKKAAQ